VGQLRKVLQLATERSVDGFRGTRDDRDWRIHAQRSALRRRNEWYKAAYYKGGGANAGYWLYPTQSDTKPSNTLPDIGNGANFYDNGLYTNPPDYLTPVGAFNLSLGPYGTFDQAGNVWEWNETAVTPLSRGYRGGSFNYDFNYLASPAQRDVVPQIEVPDRGFRIASVPEPSSMALVAVGVMVLAAAVSYAQHRRRRCKMISCKGGDANVRLVSSDRVLSDNCSLGFGFLHLARKDRQYSETRATIGSWPESVSETSFDAREEVPCSIPSRR
jgi:Sulfatase-modifying factor enzyme 1/PEP-CTERM motif